MNMRRETWANAYQRARIDGTSDRAAPDGELYVQGGRRVQGEARSDAPRIVPFQLIPQSPIVLELRRSRFAHARGSLSATDSLH